MRYLIAAVLALSAGQAGAQDNGWRMTVTPYLWLPDSRISVDTPRGTVSGELSIGDALQNLDFAFMGAIEARNGKWSLMSDILYFDLSAAAATPLGGLFNTAVIRSDITAFSVLAAYRVHQSDKFAVDVGAGLRAWWLSSEVALSGGVLAPEQSSTSDNWVDPIIAVRGKLDFGDRWFGTFHLDAGGFGVGSDHSYQAIVTVGYDVNERWSVQGGWRYIDFSRDEGGNQLDFSQSGLVLGASYRF